MDAELITRLKDYQPASAPRDPQAAARGRARFLAEAAELREAAFARKNRRSTTWASLFRKPALALASALAALIIFTSTSVTYAAQDDLPTQPLYPVKTLSEDAQLWLTADPNAKMNRLIDLAERRTEEMTALTERGETIPQQTTERLSIHIESALQIAAAQSDAEMQKSLARIQTPLQAQEKTIAQLQAGASSANQATLEGAQEMSQEQLRIANQGIEDPLAFRNRYRGPRPSVTETPTPTPTGLPVPSATAASTKSGNGYGEPNEGTPGPHSTPHPNTTPAKEMILSDRYPRLPK